MNRGAEMKQYAGFWSRLGANLVDFLVFAPLIALFIWISGISRTVAVAIHVPWALLNASYNVYFHGRWGQNIGKMVAGIRVVSVTGGPISWKQAFLRFSVDAVLGVGLAVSSVLGLLRIAPSDYATLSWTERARRVADLSPSYDFLSYATNIWIWSEVIVLLFNQRKRALHDFIAGTVVIHANPSMEPANPRLQRTAPRAAAQPPGR
jgi:uncharacterized RDD family membrane protein YckC